MKLRTALLAGVVAIVHSSAWAQTPPSPPQELPTVRAGLFSVRADGRIMGSATGTGKRTGADLTSVVYLAPCEILGASGGDRAISAAATDVWKLTGTVLELTSDQASVQIGWQRVRKDGQDDTSAPQSTTLTVKLGERTTLETISTPARGVCPARNVSLDVALEAMPFHSTGGGGVGKSYVAGKPNVVSESTGGGAVNVSAGMLKIARVDLWLVRESPGRADEILHKSGRIFMAPSEFSFEPVTVQTQAGTFTVRVRCTIETGKTPTGEPRLFFSANRTTTFAPANRAARDAAPTVEGSTKTSVPTPGPDDVLSFELPPLRVPGGATVPDKLSIRVKLPSEGK